jgi:ribonuclease Z
MMRARIGFSRLMKIFITHLHGDHVFGIPGLLQTMNLLGRERGLEIFGPVGLKGFLESVMDYSLAGLRFPLEIREISSGLIVKEKNFKVKARLAKHSIPNLAYSFEEDERPGRFHVEEALRLGIPKGPLWHKLQYGRKVG